MRLSKIPFILLLLSFMLLGGCQAMMKSKPYANDARAVKTTPNTDLEYAIRYGDAERVKAMLEIIKAGHYSKKTINEPNFADITPLQMAIDSNNITIVALLIEYGADITSGAIESAKRWMNPQIVKMVLIADAK